jgi:hypothetical protein
LFWHGGYVYDFPGFGEGPSAEAVVFLARFFSEHVVCGVMWRHGRVVGGGPVEGDEWQLWDIRFDKLELRSWRGTHDRDITHAN